MNDTDELLEKYVINENISEINKIFLWFKHRKNGLEDHIIYLCIKHSKPTLYRYYKQRGFDLSGESDHDIEVKYKWYLKNSIKSGRLTILFIEEIKNEIKEYYLLDLLYDLFKYALEVGNIDFASELALEYIDIYQSDNLHCMIAYLVEYNVRDVFLEYVKKITNMRDVRILIDRYQNIFLLKWLYDTGQMVETGFDKYNVLPEYNKLGNSYRFLLAKYNLQYKGEKVPQTIYNDYIKLLMKNIL
jgi:hypothetical protein